MRIAILGDIHSNIYAFSACVEDINKNFPDICQCVFLGDNLTDCPNVRETLQLIYRMNKEVNCIFVKGNREEYLLDLWDEKLKKQYSSSMGSICYTLDMLEKSDIEFLRKMPISKKISLNGYSVTFCHGSPTSTTEHIYPSSPLFEKSKILCNSDILVAGHNHNQCHYKVDDFLYINPDAISFVKGKPGITRYAVLDISKNGYDAQMVQIPYNTKKLINDFDTTGILNKGKVYSIAMKKSIEKGIDYVYNCAVLGHKMAKEQHEIVEKLSLPDKYWLKAANELKIIN